MTIKTLVILANVLLLAACQSLTYTLQVDANRLINIDQRNQALTVSCKAYLLKDLDRFRQASYQQLWLNDEAVLADSVLAKKTWIHYPGRSQAISFNHHPQAIAIGVVALFRNPSLGRWRLVIPLPAFVSLVLPLKLTLNRNTIMRETS